MHRFVVAAEAHALRPLHGFRCSSTSRHGAPLGDDVWLLRPTTPTTGSSFPVSGCFAWRARLHARGTRPSAHAIRATDHASRYLLSSPRLTFFAVVFYGARSARLDAFAARARAEDARPCALRARRHALEGFLDVFQEALGRAAGRLLKDAADPSERPRRGRMKGFFHSAAGFSSSTTAERFPSTTMSCSTSSIHFPSMSAGCRRCTAPD